ncbi:hypothetical protein AsAng_0009140 [Aureispira anguillae]|uniref:Uncharacterized protein n=1 Tax=Aureispira anguillae TaxID=2864201 RepID=A0A916DPL5_9BACT|nr:hypothetical protein AsAng_0009140 [Aureispira anguillae]
MFVSVLCGFIERLSGIFFEKLSFFFLMTLIIFEKTSNKNSPNKLKTK